MARTLAKACGPVLLSVVFLTSGCESVSNPVTDAVFGTGKQNGELGYISGFLGGVVADEPHAALVGRDVLSAGGSAADAATAMGLALAVTLPSRAGLGGGGGCLVFAAGSGTEAVTFLPRAATHPVASLFALHAKYGNRTFESLLAPAEKLAREGFATSRAFAGDLAVVAGPLGADPAARAIFFPSGHPVQEGEPLQQLGLAGTLSQLRQSGVGDLYQGTLAHLLVDTAGPTAGGLTIEDLRAALPGLGPPLTVAAGSDEVAFLPPPADGGLAAAAAFKVLQHDPAAQADAGAAALAAAAHFRQVGGDAQAVLTAGVRPAPLLPPLPASTTFAALDRRGNAVACALTMNNLFGTGRVAAGTGILMAASPAWHSPPLLSVAIAASAGSRPDFRAAVGGSGQAGAPLAAAVALTQALADSGRAAVPLPTPVPDPGRANVIQCNRYLPGDSAACGWAADPRGAGLALGSAN